MINKDSTSIYVPFVGIFIFVFLQGNVFMPMKIDKTKTSKIRVFNHFLNIYLLKKANDRGTLNGHFVSSGDCVTNL